MMDPETMSLLDTWTAERSEGDRRWGFSADWAPDTGTSWGVRLSCQRLKSHSVKGSGTLLAAVVKAIHEWHEMYPEETIATEASANAQAPQEPQEQQTPCGTIRFREFL